MFCDVHAAILSVQSRHLIFLIPNYLQSHLLSHTHDMRLFRLGHGVECAAVLEPVDLAGVEGVLQLDLVGLAVLGVHGHDEGLAGLELGAGEVDLK